MQQPPLDPQQEQMGQTTSPQGTFQSSQQQAGRMGQAIQQPGQSTQGGTGMASGQGLALQDVETPEQSEAVYRIMRAVQTCAWCADQCVQEASPMMTDCIRLCEDVTELGEAALAMIPRQSPYAQTLLQAFIQAAQACAQECGQHSHSHCQECAQVLGGAIQAAQQYTQSGQQAGQGGQQWSGTSM